MVVKANDVLLTVPVTGEFVVVVVMSGVKVFRDCSCGSKSEGKKSRNNFDLHDVDGLRNCWRTTSVFRALYIPVTRWAWSFDLAMGFT